MVQSLAVGSYGINSFPNIFMGQAILPAPVMEVEVKNYSRMTAYARWVAKFMSDMMK